ncbi:hypothetical protein HHI36_017284 [Cryptolaemus montrouzieri]|uniref:phytanoyl-CoA dioxygenase n=1 Tax=Cryptolaemus montrouzieri TaxID=559131 RepID=A0ABD2NN35_9CUCU
MNNQFRYTKNNNTLSDEQRQFYEENGYILIKNNVPHALIDKLIDRFIDICEGKIKVPLPFILAKDRSLKSRGFKGQYLMNKIQDFLYDEEYFKYASLPSVVDVVESIIGPNIVAVHSMLINKPPDAHPKFSQHPLHQDQHYFPFRPANNIVGAWTAMEKVNEDNGCLFVIPGSHRRETLLKHEYPTGVKNCLYHGIFGLEKEPTLNLIMEKGDTVFFHPMLLHGSRENRTKGFRKAISVHYADTYCYFIDVEDTHQKNIVREVEYITKQDYITYWKMKSRHIRGNSGCFRNLPSHL